MRRSRLYLEPPLTAGSRALSRDQSHYLARVLRMATGAELEVFDGLGSHAEAMLSHADARRGELQVSAPQNARQGESSLNLTLAVVLAKGQRMDQLLQKSTELGVTRIQLLTSERCEVRLDAGRADNRMAHWRSVTISACEQCQRTCLPELLAPVKLTEWLAEPRSGWVLHPTAEAGPPGSNGSGPNLSVLTGPEGGFTEAEVALATERGLAAVRLGPRVLRAETAPLTALSLAQFLYGDLGG